MKTINRYLLKEFTKAFAAVFAVFMLLFLVVDCVEKLRMFLKYRPAPWDMLLFFIVRTPWMAVQTLPMAALTGTLMGLIGLARNREIIALRCCGISLKRACLPFLAGGLAVSAVSLLLQEFAVPPGFSTAVEIKEVRIKGKDPSKFLRELENAWIRSENRFIHVDEIEPASKTLKGLDVGETEGGRLKSRIIAEKATWVKGRWILFNAEIRDFLQSGKMLVRREAKFEYPLAQKPEWLISASGKPDELSWSELGERIERRKSQGLRSLDLEVARWIKTSMPFASLIMVMLGFPFAVRVGNRGGNYAVGGAIAMALGLAYWTAMAVGASLGKTGVLSPALAAWGGNLAFAAFGAFLLFKAEEN